MRMPTHVRQNSPGSVRENKVKQESVDQQQNSPDHVVYVSSLQYQPADSALTWVFKDLWWRHTHSLTSHTSCHGRIIVDLTSANPLEKRSGNFPSSDLNHENFNRVGETTKPQSNQEDKTATHAFKQNQIFGLDLLKLSLGIFYLYD